MNEFVFNYPVKNFFGQGAVRKYLPSELKKYGNTVLLAYGGGSIKRNGIYDEVIDILNQEKKTIVELSGIMSNPTYEKVQEGAKLVKDNAVDFILAVGGGSVSDCCKVIAAQAKVNEDIWTMEFEKGKMPTEFIPMGTIITVSGTGSEQNCGAVITNHEKESKAGMMGAFADFAVLDPAYTLTVPMKQAVSGAFDTLSHAMETYFGKGENVSDDLALAIMKNTIQNIRLMIQDPKNISIRGELEWDSAMAENGILKIGKITDFQAHQIEHQLGAFTNCNHGAGLAVIHPALYRHIYKAGLPKFKRFAQEVFHVQGNTDEETALLGIDALEAFIKEIGLPTHFSELGITDETIIRKTADTCNITPGCCKQLSRDEIFALLKEVM